MTINTGLFNEYEQIVAKADSAFSRVEKDYPGCINCAAGCTDCCYSVFGLFLIESVYLKYHFDKLDRKVRREAVLSANRADKELAKIEQKVRNHGSDSGDLAQALGKERVKCPLLNGDGKCIVYPYRPVTCRVYGIPTISNGKIHVCYNNGFEAGKTYPTFNLDHVFRELYLLSRKFLGQSGQRNLERASLLLSVPKIIKTPVADLVKEDAGK